MSMSATPSGSGLHTGHVLIPGRDRTGTVVGRPTWDDEGPPGMVHQQQTRRAHAVSRSGTVSARSTTAPGRPGLHSAFEDDNAPSTSTSRPDSETEDDTGGDSFNGDGYVEMESSSLDDERPRAIHRQNPQHQLHQPRYVNTHQGRRTIGIVSDSPSPTAAAAGGRGGTGGLASESLDSVDLDAHIVINIDNLNDDGAGEVRMGGMVGVDMGMMVGALEGGMVGGVDDGILQLGQNVDDDLAMGAPPGAPGAIDTTPHTRAHAQSVAAAIIGGFAGGAGERERRIANGGGRRERRVEITPRGAFVSMALPLPLTMPPTHAGHGHDVQPDPTPVSMAVTTGGGGAGQREVRIPTENAIPRGVPTANLPSPGANVNAGVTSNTTTSPTTAPPTTTPGTAPPTTGPTLHQRRHHHGHHHGDHDVDPHRDVGPFREEEVLLSLQLLAYLSKDAYVRQAFYKPRTSFHPATAPYYAAGTAYVNAGTGAGLSSGCVSVKVPAGANLEDLLISLESLTSHPKEQTSAASARSLSVDNSSQQPPQLQNPTQPKPQAPHRDAQNQETQQQQPQQRVTNVFSLVQRFTFRPPPTEANLANPPPFLPADIQYWAGVIMQNACRKDESRGGIRQCANSEYCGPWFMVHILKTLD